MRTIFYLFLFSSIVFASSFIDELDKGASYYKKGQYEKALEIFDRALINHPNSKRARLEYARVLFAMGRYEESKKEFLIVLNQNPPPLVKKNIKWFLKKIKKRQKTNFFNGFVAVGVVSDNNIENKSDNPVYAGFIDSNTQKREDRYITAELFLQHTKKFESSLWQNALYLYNESSHDKSEDKISYFNLTSSYKFFISGIRVTLPIGVSLTTVDNKKYIESITSNPCLSKKLLKNNILMIKFLSEYNKNVEDNDKSSKVLGIRTKIINRFKKLTTSVGLTYKDFKRVSGDRIDIAKKRGSIDIATSYNIFPTNFLRLFYKKSKDIYDKKDPSINDERVDKLDKFNINFQQSIGKNRFFELGFTKISNKSNLDIFSYDKDVYSLKIKQTF